MRASDVVALAAAVVVAAGVAVLPGGDVEQDVEQHVDQLRARSVPVERAELVCPPMPGEGSARAAVTAVPLAAETDLERNPVRVTDAGSTLTRIGTRGEVWKADSDAVGAGVTVRATGALAAGLNGVVTADVDSRRVSGRATAVCVPPKSSWWFVGAGSSVGREDTLLLGNASSGVAVVDLVFHGPDGVIEDAAGDQIALDVGERRRLPLEDFVPGVRDVAVEVRVSQGQVAASLSETVLDVSEPVGADFVGPAAAPRRQAVVTGLPAGRGERSLCVVNTGDSETVVEVEVMGPSGAFTPTDFDVLRVPAGAVVTRDITTITGKQVSGLRLRADQPISAAVRARTPDGSDVSFAAAGEPLTDRAAAAVAAGVEPTVVLSAVGDQPATAEISVYDAAGERIGRKNLEIGGGQTHAWDVSGEGRPASVVVSSDHGERLTGAMRWVGSGGQSITPLLPVRTALAQPALRYDPVGP